MKIIDSLFSFDEVNNIYNTYRKLSFKRTEKDGEGLPYTGLVCDLNFEDPVVKLIIERTKNNFGKLLRAYINLFLKDEKPFFHQDDTRDGHKTLLYYMNPEPNKLDDLGETFFYINNQVQSVQPIPGRIVIFDAKIWHRASPLRDQDRYTIALKW